MIYKNMISELEKARENGEDIGAAVADLFCLTTTELEHHLKSHNVTELETLVGRALALSADEPSDQISWYLLQRFSEQLPDENYE